MRTVPSAGNGSQVAAEGLVYPVPCACVPEERADRIGSSCPHGCRGLDTGRSFNGRTRGSGPRYRGSNPCLPASLRSPSVGRFTADVPRSELCFRWRLSRRSPRSGRSRTSNFLHQTCEHGRMRGIGARFVFVLRSETDPSRHYVGRAANVDERLDWHNAGPTGYTLRHRPWRVIVSIEFPDESTAAHFERYLKSGSGRALAKRHFAPATQPNVDSSERAAFLDLESNNLHPRSAAAAGRQQWDMCTVRHCRVSKRLVVRRTD